jgi:hypothetical protein
MILPRLPGVKTLVCQYWLSGYIIQRMANLQRLCLILDFSGWLQNSFISHSLQSIESSVPLDMWGPELKSECCPFLHCLLMFMMCHLGLFSSQPELREVSVAFDMDPIRGWSLFFQGPVMTDVVKRGKIVTIFCKARDQKIRHSSYAQSLIEQVRDFLRMSIKHDTRVPPAPRYIKIYVGDHGHEILLVTLNS